MANVKKHKKMGETFGNEERTMKLSYDFAQDGGAIGTLVLANVDSKILITQAIVHVETACTSGGSATVEIGSSAGDPNGFLDATSGAVASLTQDATVIESTGPGLIVAASETIDLEIAAAALTAGKIAVQIKYVTAK